MEDERGLCGDRGEAATNKLNFLRGMKRLCQRCLSSEQPAGHQHRMVRRCLGRSPGLRDCIRIHGSEIIKDLSTDAWLGKEGGHYSGLTGQPTTVPFSPITEVFRPSKRKKKQHSPPMDVSRQTIHLSHLTSLPFG